MSVVRGTALSNYPSLVAELGGDPAGLLRAAGIREQDVGTYDTFIPFRAAIRAAESAAEATATPDFGRRLARRQGIEILGPVGVAARTAATVADALAIFNTFMAAYSPVISIQITALADPKRSFIALEFLLDEATSSPQTLELALGVSLGVFRLLMGDHYRPLAVHLPHDPLTPPADYIQYFGCTPYFAERRAGFTVRTADLSLPLNRDDIAHRAVVDYLSSITPLGAGMVESVRTIVRQLLPTGAATLDVVAEQFHLHPKTLQRRLAEKNTTFAGLVDQVRKDAADRYLRTTGISLSHLARELGYAEQSVLTRSCKRWFGTGPTAYRNRTRRPVIKDRARAQVLSATFPGG
ncbi:AraC family transcriptional regulator ligand-binding domain-containing protein [Mycobacterium shinjukuense]|uniref:AraC family transcriptional regulator n=1 Tax=Mycobacterium shinjukuense TaxID=398694 RepID=A0A7I7MTM6_9MYCO|nr:AraC family transcriptional regulator [Mycobacterium shinjukuense]MCV6986490.1 AraC family transcriptional regulator ligand-binding domain-containing protein [Mycobacterium shinjukuense]ORB70682.1 AraC family transcriptional regulator [Mycobacterium shinjukuense]BBX75446.1 AraC family transcriptional regulator [Mycobacterium shinjukuense]